MEGDDYIHPDWTQRATNVAASAYLLLKFREAGAASLEEREARRLKERLDALEAVSSGGDPDHIQRALEAHLAHGNQD